MPWGRWIELKDNDMHCEEWECIIENFTEEEANTTLHCIYGQWATLNVNYMTVSNGFSQGMEH